MRTAELGVVIVMVVVGASPNAAGAEGEDSKDPHQTLGQAGVGQYRQVLLVVINHKKPEHKQSGEKTADDPAGQMEIPDSPRQGGRQKKSSRKNAPPTPGSGIHRVGFGCRNQIFAGSQTNRI
jgi:hypothetical protein